MFTLIRLTVISYDVLYLDHFENNLLNLGIMTHLLGFRLVEVSRGSIEGEFQLDLLLFRLKLG